MLVQICTGEFTMSSKSRNHRTRKKPITVAEQYILLQQDPPDFELMYIDDFTGRHYC